MITITLKRGDPIRVLVVAPPGTHAAVFSITSTREVIPVTPGEYLIAEEGDGCCPGERTALIGNHARRDWVRVITRTHYGPTPVGRVIEDRTAP